MNSSENRAVARVVFVSVMGRSIGSRQRVSCKTSGRYLSRQHWIKLAGAFQLMQLVAAANMCAINKDLRHSAPAIGTLNHSRFLARIPRNIGLVKRNAFCFQQVLGGAAIAAKRGCIDFNLGSRRPALRRTSSRHQPATPICLVAPRHVWDAAQSPAQVRQICCRGRTPLGCTGA